MKKALLSLFSLIVLSSSIASAQTAGLPCVKSQYPDLLTGAYFPSEKRYEKEFSYVTHTIPFSKVTYLKGLMYECTHPNPQNECEEMKSVVTDLREEDLRSMVEMIQKYPRAIAKCDISIQLTYIDGVTDGVWRVKTVGRPNNPELM